MSASPWLALTPGDPAGVGPEITWKSVRTLHANSTPVRLLCVGARKPFEKLGARIVDIPFDLTPQEIAGILNGLPSREKKPTVFMISAPTVSSKKNLPGFQAGWSIEFATQLVKSGICRALVTGPISKERFNQGGFPFPGHTEFLAHLCKTKSVTMMLANDTLRITLVTVHEAISNVTRLITPASIQTAVEHTFLHLHRWWGIARPKIAVTSLNPHAGEGGLFGNTDQTVVMPTLNRLRKKHATRVKIFGPLPADTLFANHIAARPSERYDAVVCMYHDQGLIPVKLLDFPKTVNITLGLPIIRTSVDHGTGFDIAGKNLADPSSMLAAIHTALQITRVHRTGRKES